MKRPFQHPRAINQRNFYICFTGLANRPMMKGLIKYGKAYTHILSHRHHKIGLMPLNWGLTCVPRKVDIQENLHLLLCWMKIYFGLTLIWFTFQRVFFYPIMFYSRHVSIINSLIHYNSSNQKFEQKLFFRYRRNFAFASKVSIWMLFR